MSRSDTDTDPEPIPCDARAELDASSAPDRPLRIDVEIPAGFDPDEVADAIRVDVTAADE